MGEELDSYFGVGIRMDGLLTFKGVLRFDGEFKGEIVSDGSLVVGHQGDISAEISTGHLYNMGSITGNVTASSNISIFCNSHLSGNIETPILVAEEGAVLQGNCNMPAVAPKAVTGSKDESLDTMLQSSIPPQFCTGGNRHKHLGISSIVSHWSLSQWISVLATLLIIFTGLFVYKSTYKIFDNKTSRFIYLKFAEKNKDAKKLEMLGDKWSEEARYSRAQKVYKIAMKNSSANASLALKLANVLKENGEMNQATKYYFLYLQDNRNDTNVINKLLDHYSIAGDTVGEIKIYEFIVESSPDNIDAIKKLYQLYVDDKMNQKALSLYASKIVSTPKTAEDFIIIGGLYADLDLFKESIKTFEEAVDSYPRNFEIRKELAYTYLKVGLEKKAAAGFRTAGRIDRNQIEMTNNLAFIFLANLHLDRSIEKFEQVLAEDENNLRALHGLATVFSKKSDNDKAEYYCKRILQIDSNFAPALNRLAWVYTLAGTDLDKAEELSIRSMKYISDLPDYMDTLSEVYYKKGEYKKSIAWINKALELDSRNSWFKLQLSKFKKAEALPPLPSRPR